MQALYIDQIIDTIADFFLGLFKYNGSDKDELRKARETALSVGAKRYWGGMERLIGDIPGSEEGPFVLGKTVSIADAAIAGLYNLLSVEYLEFVPADALDGYERAKKVHDAVMNLPEVENYYEKHPLAKLS